MITSDFIKEDVIAAFGSVAKLIKFLDIDHPQAVYQWPSDEPIPELRQLQIKLGRPDLIEGEAA